MRTRISVSLFVILSALVFVLSCNYPVQDTEWKNLFEGKSLNGWMVKCRPQDKEKHYWKVDKGTITAEVPQGSKHHYIWLLTKAEYSDFELRLKVQSYAASTGNSGIQVRSRYDDQAGWLDGPQVDINPPGAWRCGFIYDETREVKQWISPITGPPSKAKPSDAPRGWKWFHADQGNGWNDVHIICKGTRIKTIVNGVTVCDYNGTGILDDDNHQRHNVGIKGHIGLQIHPGKHMVIRFRDIKIKTSNI